MIKTTPPFPLNIRRPLPEVIPFIIFLCTALATFGQNMTTSTDDLERTAVDSLIKVANRLTISDPDASIAILDNLIARNKDTQDPKFFAEVYNSYGCAYNSKSVYGEAFNYFFEGLEYAEQVEGSTIRASINNNLGMLYDNFYLDQEALTYFEAAEAFYLTNPELDTQRHYTLIALNIALIKNYQEKYEEGFAYVKTARDYIEKATDINTTYKEQLMAITGIEMANALTELDSLEEAQKWAEENIAILEKGEELFPLTQGYYYLSMIYYKKDEIDKALQLAKKADSLEGIVGHKPLERDIGYLLSKLYKKDNDDKLSLQYYEEATVIQEELFSSKETWAFYRLRQDALLKEEQQKQALKEKEDALNDAFMGLYALGATSLLIIGGLFIYNLRQKHKKEKEIIEHQEAFTKNELEKTKEILELKKRELTSSALQIIQNGKTIQILKKELNGFKNDLAPKHKGRLASIMNSLKHNSAKDWANFKNRFEQVNIDFFKNIQTQYPDLTPNQIKLCAYLSLNFNTKDISDLMGISPESVKVNRYKIRKKMKLERATNLILHIQQLT